MPRAPIPIPRKWRTDNGHWIKRELFVDVLRRFAEAHREFDESKCPYWLNKKIDEDDTRPILRELFIQTGDTVGIKFANKYLGGWEHFQALLKCEWFSKAIQDWTIELKAMIKAKALERIQEIAEEGSAQSLQANKYLANEEYDEASSKRGRPTKEEVTGELKRQVKAVTQADEDYNRMTAFTVVKGGKN